MIDDENLQYAHVKMAEAVRILCEWSTDLRYRLRGAAPPIGLAWIAIDRVPDHVLPVDVRAQVQSIWDRLTKRARHRVPVLENEKIMGTVWTTTFNYSLSS